MTDGIDIIRITGSAKVVDDTVVLHNSGGEDVSLNGSVTYKRTY